MRIPCLSSVHLFTKEFVKAGEEAFRHLRCLGQHTPPLKFALTEAHGNTCVAHRNTKLGTEYKDKIKQKIRMSMTRKTRLRTYNVNFSTTIRCTYSMHIGEHSLPLVPGSRGLDKRELVCLHSVRRLPQSPGARHGKMKGERKAMKTETKNAAR